MFSRMLRPSRRQHHERVSQNEDSDNNAINLQQNLGIVLLDDSNNNNIQEHDLNLDLQEGDNTHNNSMDEEDDEDELRAALALSMQQDDTTTATTGGESQQQQPTAESSFANEQETTNSTNATTNRTTVHFTSSSSSDEEEDNDNILQPNILIRQPSSLTTQTQRELQHRRQSTCTLLLLFFLIRLWIEALIEMKPELIFLSVMGSVWTYRFFISRRLAEEENEQQDTIVANNRGESGLDPAVNYDPDLGLMSFQAQLALAILESQRQVFENTQNGGYNRNSNNDDDGPGVTPEAKSKWKIYDWGKGDNIEENTKLAVSTSRSSLEAIIERANSSGTLDNGGGGGSSRDYGTLEHEQIDIEEQKANGLLASLDDEEPSCSICLCEYEIGEKVTRLPCDHIYHTSCINSWTEQHTRCPLCNHDLMEGFDQPVNVLQMARQHAEEQRAFRSMALSSLGRRIRTRRRGSSNRRGQSRGNTASALLAAAEDSIV